jgi:hypothetical protein
MINFSSAVNVFGEAVKTAKLINIDKLKGREKWILKKKPWNFTVRRKGKSR